MNVVDSSAWLEYFANGPNAAYFAKPIEKAHELVVPTIVLFEVFKRIRQQRDEQNALQALAVMHQGILSDLDSRIAVNAARLSAEHKLPMADSIIYATAQAHAAILWTQDADFMNLDGVRYRAHRT